MSEVAADTAPSNIYKLKRAMAGYDPQRTVGSIFCHLYLIAIIPIMLFNFSVSMRALLYAHARFLWRESLENK